jgi:hypothetical protein
MAEWSGDFGQIEAYPTMKNRVKSSAFTVGVGLVGFLKGMSLYRFDDDDHEDENLVGLPENPDQTPD